MTSEQFCTIYRAISDMKTRAAIELRAATEEWRREAAAERLEKAIAADNALGEAYMHPEAV